MSIRYSKDQLQVFRVDGREVLVVFEGGKRQGYRPIRDGGGWIRVVHLLLDGKEPAVWESEYAWANPRSLRRVRRLDDEPVST